MIHHDHVTLLRLVILKWVVHAARNPFKGLAMSSQAYTCSRDVSSVDVVGKTLEVLVY